MGWVSSNLRRILDWTDKLPCVRLHTLWHAATRFAPENMFCSVAPHLLYVLEYVLYCSASVWLHFLKFYTHFFAVCALFIEKMCGTYRYIHWLYSDMFVRFCGLSVSTKLQQRFAICKPMWGLSWWVAVNQQINSTKQTMVREDAMMQYTHVVVVMCKTPIYARKMTGSTPMRVKAHHPQNYTARICVETGVCIAHAVLMAWQPTFARKLTGSWPMRVDRAECV